MKIIFATVIIFACTQAQCQEFWLQPKKFHIAVGEELKVNFVEGINFVGEPIDLSKNPLAKIELHQPHKQTPLKTDGSDKIIASEPGIYILSAESAEVIASKSADDFNNYLKEQGFDEILNTRTKTNTLNNPAREGSFKYSKLIVKTGDKVDDTYKKKIGTKLEIVPLQNPTELASGNYLQCLILFEGKPLPHQPLKIWNKIGNASIQQNAYTENDGIVKFPISSRGPWMISTTKMIASQKRETNWLNFQSSLTFGIK